MKPLKLLTKLDYFKYLNINFAGAKGISFCDTTVTVKGAMTDETVAQLEKLADEVK